MKPSRQLIRHHSRTALSLKKEIKRKEEAIKPPPVEISIGASENLNPLSEPSVNLDALGSGTTL